MSAFDDLANEYINAEHYKRATAKPFAMTGSYQGRLGKPKAGVWPDSFQDLAGVKRLSSPVKLYDEDGELVGEPWFDTTWVEIEEPKYGANPAKLYWQTFEVITGGVLTYKDDDGNECRVSVKDVAEAWEGTLVTVYGQATFKKVRVGDLPEFYRHLEQYESKADDATITIRIRKGEEELAAALIEAGYGDEKHYRFEVLAITEPKDVEF